MAKIMIIDDDPNIVTYLTDIFTDNGYQTCSAADGSQAMEIVKNEQPDLITLDIEMPEEWGPRFYRKLSQDPEYKRIPVIVVSGLAGNKYAIPKAVASLTKPFDPSELIGIVKEVLGQ
ncbi:response regulator receiver protein [Desulfovibrio ferrophilus]|uniref:Response regulator receiver protein n=2 Tax=Desulfovibrio ferrophilus TaxID=241368 RepID=A0A2Z6B3H2_9BACT|nr:response regulator receiver protein [Desulfovibrio ferrophilus]